MWVNAALGEHKVDLVGWDYSSADPLHYEQLILKHVPLLKGQRHFALSVGMWSWNRFWAALPWALDSLDAQVAAANKTGVTQIYAATWQDDGAEVAPVSVVAGVMYFLAAVHAANGKEAPTRGDVKRRADGLFAALAQQGNLFNDCLEAAALDSAPGVPTGWGTTNTAKWLLWEDPLLTHLSPQVRAQPGQIDPL
eukprot:299009-Prorocentrum_minimum.AAC.1